MLGLGVAFVVWCYFVIWYSIKSTKKRRKNRSGREEAERKRMLTLTAIGEHENNLLPHIDPNVIAVCTVPSCNWTELDDKMAQARFGKKVHPGIVYPEVSSLREQYQDVPAEPILRPEPLPVDLRAREEMMDRALHAFNLYRPLLTANEARELGYPSETLASKLRKLDKQDLTPDERDAAERYILATWRHTE